MVTKSPLPRSLKKSRQLSGAGIREIYRALNAPPRLLQLEPSVLDLDLTLLGLVIVLVLDPSVDEIDRAEILLVGHEGEVIKNRKQGADGGRLQGFVPHHTDPLLFQSGFLFGGQAGSNCPDDLELVGHRSARRLHGFHQSVHREALQYVRLDLS